MDKPLFMHLMRQQAKTAKNLFQEHGRLSAHLTGYFLGMIDAYSMAAGTDSLDEAEQIKQQIMDVGRTHEIGAIP